MEKLVVISENGAYLLNDAKKFDHKWMENVNGEWKNIDTFHFEVSHLSEQDIDEFIVFHTLAKNALKESMLKEEEFIDDGIFFNIDQIEYNKQIDFDYSFNTGELIEWDTLEYGDRTFTIDIGEVCDDNAKVALSELMDSYNAEINWEDEQGQINTNEYLSGIDIVDEMVHLIALMTDTIMIDCEDPKKEEAILKYLSKFDLNTKDLVENVLNNGTVTYEKIYGDNRITVDRLELVNQTLVSVDEIELNFYPNDEFDSYTDMMYKTYFDFKLDKQKHVLDCGSLNVSLDSTYDPSFLQRSFIQKSFIESRYFNINEVSKNTIGNDQDANNFMDMLHTNIVDFYTDLIRSDERFKYYNFSLNF